MKIFAGSKGIFLLNIYFRIFTFCLILTLEPCSMWINILMGLNFWLSLSYFHVNDYHIIVTVSRDICLIQTFWKCLFVKKFQNKFLYVSVKSLTNSENASSNPLQGACSAFPEAACEAKSCSESRLWFWKLFRKPAMTVRTGEIQPQTVKESRKRNFIRLIHGTTFWISKCFRRNKQKLIIYIFVWRDRLKV